MDTNTDMCMYKHIWTSKPLCKICFVQLTVQLLSPIKAKFTLIIEDNFLLQLSHKKLEFFLCTQRGPKVLLWIQI